MNLVLLSNVSIKIANLEATIILTMRDVNLVQILNVVSAPGTRRPSLMSVLSALTANLA